MTEALDWPVCPIKFVKVNVNEYCVPLTIDLGIVMGSFILMNLLFKKLIMLMDIKPSPSTVQSIDVKGLPPDPDDELASSTILSQDVTVELVYIIILGIIGW